MSDGVFRAGAHSDDEFSDSNVPLIVVKRASHPRSVLKNGASRASMSHMQLAEAAQLRAKKRSRQHVAFSREPDQRVVFQRGKHEFSPHRVKSSKSDGTSNKAKAPLHPYHLKKTHFK